LNATPESSQPKPHAAANAGARNGYVPPLGHYLAVVGFILFAVFAPHSIAAAEIALAIATAGWLLRTISTGRAGLRHTKLDWPILLFFLWTIASAILSVEPGISSAKLQSVCVLFIFYLTQAIVTKRTAIILVSIMTLSGVAGTVWSLYDLIRGRGVVVASVAADSPFRQIQAETGDATSPFKPPVVQVEKGDAVWRVGGYRVYSVSEIDEVIRKAGAGSVASRLSVSVITHGEHAEWPGFVVTQELKARPSPSGISGAGRSHRFRASGWTRHYEYFAEILQILAQLSLGLALANLRNHGANRRFRLAIVASLLLAFGIAFTAMRTVLVAFAIGACVIAWRASRGATKLILTAAIAGVLGFGAVVIWETRAINALSLQDASSSLRTHVARVGLSRILLHPIFGHGMDAMKKHWSEWGFPGNVMIHLHSTPLQIAFDRGLPALFYWLWIIVAFWLLTTRAEKFTRDSGDTNRQGILLGATGALAGFFASSLVNYNFGAGIVALVFWWLMGVVVVLARNEER
jgi:O-Antigen ligase